MAHVLVADDSPTVRRVLGPILRGAHHTVSEAADGEETLVALNGSSEPLVVLLDVVMPKLGGIGVLTAMEASDTLRDRHAFILMTGTPDAIPPRAVSDLLQRFSIPLVVKPINPIHLLHLVDQAAERLPTITSDPISDTQP